MWWQFVDKRLYLSYGRVQYPATCFHEVTETFEVFRLLGNRLLLSADQQLLAAFVEDAVVDNLQLAQLADELDVAQHLAFGQKPKRWNQN